MVEREIVNFPQPIDDDFGSLALAMKRTAAYTQNADNVIETIHGMRVKIMPMLDRIMDSWSCSPCALFPPSNPFEDTPIDSKGYDLYLFGEWADIPNTIFVSSAGYRRDLLSEVIAQHLWAKTHARRN